MSAGETRDAATPPAGRARAASDVPAKLPLTALSGGPIPTHSATAEINANVLRQASAPVAAEDLPLGAGDLVEISVFEVPELSNLKMRIPPTGRITFPLLGSISAAGRTPLQLEEEIRTRLQQKYVHDPQVSVFVAEQRSHRVSVVGAVRRAGVISFTGPLRLADAIAMSEGLADNADPVIYLIRRVPSAATPAGSVPPLPGAPADQVMMSIDLEALAQGNHELNVALQSGDAIHVSPAGSYYVGGEVEKPGSFPLTSRTTLDQAIIAAGGMKNVADWSDVRIYRSGPGDRQDVLQFDLAEIEKGRTAPLVQKKDVILVGKSKSKAVGYGIVDFFKHIFQVGVGVSRGF